MLLWCKCITKDVKMSTLISPENVEMSNTVYIKIKQRRVKTKVQSGVSGVVYISNLWLKPEDSNKQHKVDVVSKVIGRLGVCYYVIIVLFHLFKPTLRRANLTFVVGNAIVKALCSIWSCGSVEGLHRERAGWWGLWPMFKQYLFYRSKLNYVIFQFITFWFSQMFPIEWAYRHHGEGTDSHHGLWPMTRPLLHHSHRTPLHCSYPAVPRSPLSWPPVSQTTLFIHTHTHTQHMSHTAHSQNPKLSEKWSFSISTPVDPCYYRTDKTMTQTLLQ